MQPEPLPKAPEQVWTPELREVIAPEPNVPPLPTVVVPDKCGRLAIPELGATALGVASPYKIDSCFWNALAATVIDVSVFIKAGTPLVSEPKLRPPIFPLVVESPTVTDGVIFVPLIL